MNLSIGKMRHRIRFQICEHTTSENGYGEECWTDYGRPVWAEVNDLFGREFYAAAAAQMENTVKFRVRYRAEVDASMRIVFHERIYDIIAIDNMGYRGGFMIIRAREVAAKHGRQF